MALSVELTQVEKIVYKFGGQTRLAKMLGISRSAIARWNMPHDKGGAGGRIPSKRLKAILDAADLLGIEVTMEDLRS